MFLLVLCSVYIYLLHKLVHFEKSTLRNNLPGKALIHPPESVATEFDSESIKWEWQLLHVINTRFMQNQPSLPNLARARLKLFKYFCFPTILNQTSKTFLWIIKVDPNLDNDIILELIDMLKPYPNFFLVGSNVNFLSGNGSQHGSWRGGDEGHEILSSKIYTGDLSLLRGALAIENKQVVLETRLDADDGLNLSFVEFVQKSAAQYLVGRTDSTQKNNKVKWRYWCLRSHIEWFADGHKYGELSPIEHSHFCVTPGLTVGFGVGTSYDSVLQASHDVLFKQVRDKGDCGLGKGNNCIEMMSDIGMAAIRTRTPTSSGMMRIDLEMKLSDDKSNELWDILTHSFSISKENAIDMKSYIHDNMEAIAAENSLGQCTQGHSCKLASKEKLLRLQEMAKYQNMLQYMKTYV